jgi:hypothetical protein
MMSDLPRSLGPMIVVIFGSSFNSSRRWIWKLTSFSRSTTSLLSDGMLDFLPMDRHVRGRFDPQANGPVTDPQHTDHDFTMVDNNPFRYLA